MRLFPLALVPLVVVGCTNLALERHTLRQIETVSDLRYKEALGNLALFSAEPWSLPAYTTIYAGTSRLSDTGTIGPSTVVGREVIGKTTATMTKFQSGVVDAFGQRNVTQTWTLDPVTSPEKMRAIRACCLWVLYGKQSIPPADFPLLTKYQDGMLPGHYFDVEEELANIPHGWLKQGCLTDLPKHAAYHAHYGVRCVWVCESGVDDLSKFCLVVQKIVRTATDDAYYPRPATRKITFNDMTERGDLKVSVTAYVDDQGRLVSGDGKRAVAVKRRLENLNADAALRSQISASSSTK
jgi:hypothetical protein